MEIRFTRSFERDYRELPKMLQKAIDRKLFFLLENFNHPSLHAKKMRGYKNIWECRINRGFRFTFSIVKQIYFIRRVGPHDILRKP